MLTKVRPNTSVERYNDSAIILVSSDLLFIVEKLTTSLVAQLGTHIVSLRLFLAQSLSGSDCARTDMGSRPYTRAVWGWD